MFCSAVFCAFDLRFGVSLAVGSSPQTRSNTLLLQAYRRSNSVGAMAFSCGFLIFFILKKEQREQLESEVSWRTWEKAVWTLHGAMESEAILIVYDECPPPPPPIFFKKKKNFKEPLRRKKIPTSFHTGRVLPVTLTFTNIQLTWTNFILFHSDHFWLFTNIRTRRGLIVEVMRGEPSH